VSFHSPKAEPPSFALQALHAGAKKSHDFCYAPSQYRHVAENVSFHSPKAERPSSALQTPPAPRRSLTTSATIPQYRRTSPYLISATSAMGGPSRPP
jgi:hypothetical protein